MPSINLINVLDLLTRSKQQGLLLSFSDDEVRVKVPRQKPAPQELLQELKDNREQLLEYFRYYEHEFKFLGDKELDANTAHYSGLAAYAEPGKTANEHLLLLNDAGSQPLFVLPGSGGKSGGYQMLANCFNGMYTVYGLEMMGTQQGEIPLPLIPDIAAQNLRWIREIQPRGPYRFIAHSFGAYVVYEMARQLEAAGESISFIAILDQQLNALPGLPDYIRPVDYVMELVRDYFESFQILSPPYPEWLAGLPEKLETLSGYEIVPYVAAFTSRHMPHAARIIEYVARLINIRVYNDTMVYHPAGMIASPVLVFKAADNEEPTGDDTLGWSAFAGTITVSFVPGNHHNIVEDKSAVEIAGVIKQWSLPVVQPVGMHNV